MGQKGNFQNQGLLGVFLAKVISVQTKNHMYYGGPGLTAVSEHAVFQLGLYCFEDCPLGFPPDILVDYIIKNFAHLEEWGWEYCSYV